MKRFGRWFGRLGLVVISLLLAEALLQAISRRVDAVGELLEPSAFTAQQIADSAVDYRGNPRWHDHDASGFRNPAVVSQADIVTLGDSHTYGAGVARSDVWPTLLGQMSSQPVYNMAFFGWGPAQGYILLDQALSLQPNTIIYGLYLGNDLFDVYDFASRRPGLQRFLPRPFTDTSALLEAKDPMGPRVAFLFALGDTAVQQRAGSFWSFQRYLSQNSRLYGVARAFWHFAAGTSNRAPALLSRDMDRALERMTERQRSFVAVHRDPEWKTLLTPSYRNLVIDTRDPRIRAGLVGIEGLLETMNDRCRQKSVRFLVVILPTKESVFAPRVRNWSDNGSLDSLVRNEKQVHDEIVDWLRVSNIEFLDMLPALQKSTLQPYFVDADGHPNRIGHKVIAESVSERLLTPR